MASSTFLTLPFRTTETREVLWSGRIIQNGVTFRALPVETKMIAGHSANEQIIFEITALESADLDSSKLYLPKKKWFIIFRAYSITATLMPCMAVLIYGLFHHVLFQRLPVSWHYFAIRSILALIGAVLLQLAINVLNDVEDHLRLIDLPDQNGGSGALQGGWISARTLYRIGIGCFVFAALCGLPAFVAETKTLLIPLVAAAIGVLGYSGKPFGLKYRSMGDLAVFLLCGPLLTLAYSVASFGTFDAGVIWLGLVLGFAAIVILHANNLQDIPTDTKRGAYTLASLLGFSKAKYAVIVFYAATLVSLIGFGWKTHSYFAIATSLLATPLMLKLSRKTVQASGPHSPLLNQTRVEAAQIHLALGVLLSLGLFF